MSDNKLEAVQKRLPLPLLDLCTKFGRYMFMDGLLQVVHPSDLQLAVDLVFEGDKDLGDKKAYPFAYSAFGTIYFWHPHYGIGDVDVAFGQVTCDEITHSSPDRSHYENTVYMPFMLERASYDLFDTSNKLLFKRAQKKLGRLEYLEWYGIVPALG